jgi:type VI secretion system ImpJ/VasE family protein
MLPRAVIAGPGGVMRDESQVAWREGLFLRPQHFQQQDRFVDALVRARTRSLRPYPWGFSELKVNIDLAALGKFALERCVGLLPDGTPVSVPDDQAPFPPLDVPADTRDAIVYLTVPARQPGAWEFQVRQEATEAIRYLVDEEDVADAASLERAAEPIEVARPNLKFGVTEGQTQGRVCIGLARVREVLNGQIQFDDRYIPPSADIRASVRLAGFVSDIIGRADQRGEELAIRAVDSAAGGSESLASYFILQAINRWGPQLKHLQSLPGVHPERLYELFVGFAGELATHLREDRKPPAFPDYDHEDLRGTFEPVVNLLVEELSRGFDRGAEQLPLNQRAVGAYESPITDRNLYRTGYFYLAVAAAASLDEIRARFPGIAKIGPIEKMRQIVGAAIPGIPLRHTPTPPPQIRVLPGFVYFELDRSTPDWRDFATSTALGLHVSGEWPSLRMELWCVKRPGR